MAGAASPSGGRSSKSQARSSRSWRRASVRARPGASAALDERERLQHRVVQVGGDLGALLGADALAPLDAEVAPQAHDPRPEQQRHADAGGEHREPEPADGRQHAAGREQHAEPDDEQHARRRPPARAGPAGAVAASSVRAHTSPNPTADERHRPHHAGREHQARPGRRAARRRG